MAAGAKPSKIRPQLAWSLVAAALAVFVLAGVGYTYWHAREMAHRAQVHKEQQQALAQLRARAKQRQLQNAQEAERSRKLKEEDDRARAQNEARQKAIYQRDKAQADFYQRQEDKKSAEAPGTASESAPDAPSPPPPSDAYSEGTGPDQAVTLPPGGDIGQSPTY